MRLELIRLTTEYKDELISMIEEWRLDQINNHTDTSPWAIFRCDCHDFDKYLEAVNNYIPDDKHVPDTTLFLADLDTKHLIGAVNIRHYLNESLLFDGGHIGDGIRPSERRKGYATKMIGLALKECKKLGIDKVLMTCDKSNIGSKKSIINNGGILENEVIDDKEHIIERYWIIL